MDIQEKLNLLGQAARFDDCAKSPTCGSPSGFPENYGLFAPSEATCSAGPDMFPYVSHVQRPDGAVVPVLKVLQTSACQNNCRYCAFRAGRDVRRAHFTPDELAHAFDLMQRAGVVQGIFLSSGVMNTTQTMDEMLATVELIRGKYASRGYVHLKLLPGAEAAHIARAVALADRVSVNLEAPTPPTLAALAPQKRMEELVGPLRTAAEIIRKLSPFPSQGRAYPEPAEGGVGGVRLGMSTQFVVGPAGESDRELLTTVQGLYREVRLARAYYSAFSPVRNTPLENAAPTDPRREFRLYQADWLLRYYGFATEELPFSAGGNLPETLDPKAAWAQAHPERFPIEVNRASLSDLLRIPGIGPTSARAIIQARRQSSLVELGDLRKLGARADRAAPYVLLAGKRPPYQPPLPL
jgi:predicted DNA-binding helix-hairpin-helix protein